ncbi:hypothetical protein [Tepidimonas sp.]
MFIFKLLFLSSFQTCPDFKGIKRGLPPSVSHGLCSKHALISKGLSDSK